MISRILLSLSAACLIGGCASRANLERPLSAELASIEATPRPPTDQSLDLTPEAISLDRSDWTPTRVRVPLDAPHVAPTYTTRWVDDPERSTAYPTPLSSVDGQAIVGGLGRRSAAISITAAFFDIVAMAPRAIIDPPWQTAPNTRDEFVRTRRDAWLPEVLGVQPLDTNGDGVIRRVQAGADLTDDPSSGAGDS